MKTFYLSLWASVALAVALFNITVAFSTKNYLILGALGSYPILLSSFKSAFNWENEFFTSPRKRYQPIAPVNYIAEGHRFR